MADLKVNGVIVERNVQTSIPLAMYQTLYQDAQQIEIVESEDDIKSRKITELRNEIYKESDIDSLLGKTANALSASLNLQLKIFSAIAQAQTVEDIRNAALIAAPLMTRVQTMLNNGELLSVQAAQGVNDEDAIIEALEAMTKVARVIGAN